ncbi:mannitol 1-phosphate dehydrogenase 2 [Xylaria sp. CBS 124048]|nr:mannitol 1-phosphate dehydrogenase 2 [Xylaria sp. CBS 124048]
MAPPPSTEPFHLAIVGGGITGLTLAIALYQRNIPFTLYESAAHFGEIGAGVGFGPNTVHALELLSPQIKEAYLRCITHQWGELQDVWFSTRVGDGRKAGADGTFVYRGRPGTKLDEKLFSVAYSHLEGLEGVGGVHRAHFLDQLVHLIPPSVARFGKRLANITKASDSEDVVLHFTDGTTARHTAVLGCDGIKSTTREILLGSDKYNAVFSGKCAYRGLVPMEKALEVLDAEAAMNSQLYLGYHGHILTFPINAGKTMNVVAFASRDEWTNPQWVVHTSKEAMAADFRTWGPTAKSIIAILEHQDIWALFDMPPAPTYYGTDPRICLVGDAAHASTPHQGAGAGMGIEDCYILSSLLGEAHSARDLDRVFEAYDAVRRPRTQKLVTTSREAGMLWDLELEGDDLDAVERNMRSRMRWIWEVDLPAELETARAYLLRLSK